MKKTILCLMLVFAPSLTHAQDCIRFGNNTYEVCYSGDQVTSAVARGKKNDAKGYGGYYSHPHLVVVFAKPQESSCESSQTYFMELLDPDSVKLVRWVDKCGNTKEDGTVYKRTR